MPLPAHGSPADVRDLEGRRRARRPSPRSTRSLGAPSSVMDSNSSCKPRQMPSSGQPASRRSRSARRARARGSLHRLGNAPTPGSTPRRRRGASVVGDRRPRADVLERLLDRAEVAHPVVEDRDRAVFAQACPWSTARRLLRIDRTATRSARANALKQASIMWWALVPCGPRRAASAWRCGDGAEELLGQLGVEAGDRGGRQVGLEHAQRAPRDVDRALGRATRPSARPAEP